LIQRDVLGAASRPHDFIIVGGGIYGVSLALEASRRGLRPLLVERADFGGGTTWNSLRIVHGGLRYLQTLDLERFHHSVSQRRWFCLTYPELVEPLECLMPHYGAGLRRPTILRAALLLNDLLSRGRNAGVRPDLHLSDGFLLDADATASRFPMVDRTGLRGGALWYDAVMTSSVRVVMETLRWACHNGATALNYVECTGLLKDGRRVLGIRGLDGLSGDAVELRAPVVVNCGGPWSRALSHRLDREHEELFRPSLAFNVLLDRAPLSSAALAVAPRYPKARTYFLRPWRERTMAGTFHAPCRDYPAAMEPSEAQIDAFLADLNAAVPGLDLNAADVVRVYSGLLPSKRRGGEGLAVREVLLDHGAKGGPIGLWSVSGVKFTTAHLVAERTFRRIFGPTERDVRVRPGSDRPPSQTGLSWDDPSCLGRGDAGAVRRALRAVVDGEAVTCMDDLLLRRTDWAADPRRVGETEEQVTRLLGWKLPSRPTYPAEARSATARPGASHAREA
jgi:glycerol-3-phosphate dehydrogenase